MPMKNSTGRTIVKKIVLGIPLTKNVSTAATIDNLLGINTDGKQTGDVLLYDSDAGGDYVTTSLVNLVRSYISAGGDLSYDSATGQFSIDVEEIYSAENFDSDFILAIQTIDGSLIPNLDSTYDLGSPAKKWKDLHLSGNTIYLGGISLVDQAGSFAVKDSNGAPAAFSLDANTTNDLAEGGNLYYTRARFDSALADGVSAQQIREYFDGGTGVTYDSSTGVFSIGQPVATTDDVTFNNVDISGELVVQGNLTVQGTTTTINSTTVSINDKNIVLADSAADAIAADGAGITINGADASLTYSAAEDKFVFDKGVIAPNYQGVYLGFDSDLARTSTVQSIRGYFNAAGDLSYNSATGEFSFDVEQVYTKDNFDSDFNDALDEASINGLGLSYNSATNTISITNTGVTANTYGSATRIPVFSVNAQGQLTLATETSIASVESIDFDSASGNFNITTTDGQSFNTVITLDPYTTSNLTEGNDLYYTRARFDSALGDTASIQSIRSYLNAGGDMSYDANTGTFSINVEEIYTAVNFDSDLDAAVSGGVGINYNPVDNTINIDSAELASYFSTDNITEGGNLYYTTARADSDARYAISAGGDISYDPTTGVISIDVEDIYTKANFDSDFNVSLDEAALNGDGLSYNSGTNTLSITATGVDSGTYGSTTQIPVFTVNDRGQINSIDTVLVAGVASTSYDSSSGQLTINTADGGSFVTTLHDSADHVSRARYAITSVDNGGDGSFTYNASTGVLTYTGPSASEVRSHFSASGELNYDSATGQFSFDVEAVYTKANFDSDFNVSLDEAALGGTGLTYNSGTNTLDITNTGVVAGEYGSATQVPIITVNAQGQIDSISEILVAGVTDFAFDSSNGQFTISTADGGSFTAVATLDPYTTTDLVEGDNLYYTTARADSDAKNAVSAVDAGGDGSFTYNNGTGAFTYTGPSASEVRAHLAASTGITYNPGTGLISTNDSEIVHDNLTGFVANEHVDHTAVEITAGAGLTGGGDISLTRTINIGSGTGITVNADNIEIGQDVATTANVVFAQVTATTFLGTLNGTATNALNLDSQDGTYYLNYNNFTNVPTNVSVFSNDAGYLTAAIDSIGVNDLITTAIDNLVGAAPGSLDTLNELANALGDDPNFAASVTGLIAAKLDSAQTIELIDSAYVQVRQLPQDFTYSALTGVPINVSTFVNDANYLDSTTVQGVINSSYVNGLVDSVDNATTAAKLNNQAPSFYLDYNNFSNTPTFDSAPGAFTTLSASGTTTLSSLTASTALALNGGSQVVSVTNTGSGSNVLATSPTLVTPALGTPSALVGTNITGTAAGLTAGNVTTNANLTGAVTSVGNATSLGSFSSANLAAALTDETGTGSVVFATSPTLVTPALGTPSSLTLTNATDLPVTGGGTGVATLTDKGVLFGNGTAAVGITDVGTATHVLTSNGAGLAPTFQAAGGGGGTALELYAENPVSPTAPSAVGNNAVAIGSGAATSGAQDGIALGTNAAAGNKGVSIGQGTVAGNGGVAIGGYTYGATASGAGSVAIGGWIADATASSSYAVAIGEGTDATSAFSLAIGNDAQAVSGERAIAIGQSRASGAGSFAAAIANNTATYGASGANSIAMGSGSKASSSYSIAIGWLNTAGNRSLAIGGQGSTATDNSVCVGTWESNITSAYSAAIGGGKASDRGVQNRWAFGLVSAPILGGAQGGLFVKYVQTTNATPAVLKSNSGATASTNNQVILSNNSAYAFHGTIIARQQAATGSDYASWEIKGALLRDGSAATTVLGNGIQDKLYATAGASAWAITLTADTTNGGLKIEVTGAAATNIRWVATVNTSEVGYT